ncbi:hypothetical protein BDV19DRAFT_379477 [Aspergillus venezuelensis]
MPRLRRRETDGTRSRDTDSDSLGRFDEITSRGRDDSQIRDKDGIWTGDLDETGNFMPRNRRGRTRVAFGSSRESLDGADSSDADDNAEVRMESQFKNGRTPLHTACSTGTIEMIELLLQHDADIEAVDARGRTPLHIACTEREYSYPEEAVKLLVDEGADVNRARTIKPDVAMILIREGADINVRDDLGRTPLHQAVAEGSTRMFRLLLEHGAEVNAVDKRGYSALHLCVDSNRGYYLEDLLRMGGDPNIMDNDGDTVLHHACRYRTTVNVELLLKHDADLGIENRAGLTAVEVARKRGRRNILKVIRDWNPEAARSSDKQNSSGEAYGSKLVMMEGKDDEDVAPNNASPEQNPSPADNVWAGVRRDNGDGFILAQYNNHDVSFDAKLESISPRVHEGKDMHELQIRLNFMRPYSLDYRIRYANIDVMLEPGAQRSAPSIRHIMPQADRVEVSEQEITSGKTFTVGANGNGGPSNVNISMEGSKSKRATFKGVRIIHGAVKDSMHAAWRLYEEPGSRSGLPEIVRLLLLVHCEDEFGVSLALSVKASHFLTFGIPRTLSAPTGPVYTVPQLKIITAYQEESRLRQMLDVADRAALMIENSNKLEDRFSRAMRDHARRHLILQAGTKENHLQDWTDILDHSQIGDFRTLREKLLEIEEEGRPMQRSRRRIIEDRVLTPHLESDYSDSDLADGRPSRRRLSRRYPSKPGYSYEQGEEYISSSQKPVNTFSAVGPGYHVSRLA